MEKLIDVVTVWSSHSGPRADQTLLMVIPRAARDMLAVRPGSRLQVLVDGENRLIYSLLPRTEDSTKTRTKGKT